MKLFSGKHSLFYIDVSNGKVKLCIRKDVLKNCSNLKQLIFVVRALLEMCESGVVFDIDPEYIFDYAYTLVLENYRILRRNLEHHMEFEEAGRLFISELEFARLYSVKSGLPIRKGLTRYLSIHYPYLILSLYGENTMLPLLHVMGALLTALAATALVLKPSNIWDFTLLPERALLLLLGVKGVTDYVKISKALSDIFDVTLLILRSWLTLAFTNFGIAIRRKLERKMSI